MAERRMFAKTIIDSDAFLDMPVTARLLYYDLSMRADDDGFVNSPKKIMRMVGASQDDINILILKKFIIPFDSGVVVIKHWKIHNYIRNDRYKETTYKEEKMTLEMDENNSYRLIGQDDVKQLVDQVDTNGIPVVDKMDTQVRLGKDRLGKDRIGEDIYKDMSPDLKEAFDAFVQMRKSMKKPLTDRAKKMILTKLEKWASRYNDKERYMIECLDKSIESNWIGIFELQDFHDGEKYKYDEEKLLRDYHDYVRSEEEKGNTYFYRMTMDEFFKEWIKENEQGSRNGGSGVHLT